MIVLNAAAGNVLPLDVDTKESLIINVDTSYFHGLSPEEVEEIVFSQEETKGKIIYCNFDIFEFMERTKILFDRVAIYRFLEHVRYNEVSYFLYLVGKVMKRDAIVDVIVPDYKDLAEMILDDDPFSPSFEKDNIYLTTELLAQPDDPHASIWTVDRLHYFFEIENIFEPISCEEKFFLDSRDIYIRFLAKRK